MKDMEGRVYNHKQVCTKDSVTDTTFICIEGVHIKRTEHRWGSFSCENSSNKWEVLGACDGSHAPKADYSQIPAIRELISEFKDSGETGTRITQYR